MKGSVLITLILCSVLTIFLLKSCQKEELATVSTLAVTEATANSAKSGGNITSDGGGEITSRGLVWATAENPTVEQQSGMTEEGGGSGMFTSQLLGLMPGTTYFVRAYAINGAGIAYGNQETFITGNPPVAYFTAAPLIGTAPLAVSFFNQSANDPTNWSWDFGDGNTSTMQHPTHIYHVPGTYTVQLTVSSNFGSDNYIKESLIDVREAIVPETGTFTDTRNGQTYRWVKIGNQVWMAENLNFEVQDSWCYDYTSVQCDNYGRLYSWYAAMGGASSSDSNPSGVRGVCPTGWHLPSHDEWTELERYVCETLGNADCAFQYPYNITTSGWRGTNEANALKSCRQVNSPLGGDCNTSVHPRWSDDRAHYGYDMFGFSALPGSPRDSVGTFGDYGRYSVWWAATEGSGNDAWRRSLGSEFGGIHRNYCTKTNGFHVRCIKDAD